MEDCVTSEVDGVSEDTDAIHAASPREVELKLELEPGSDGALLDHPLIRDRIGAPRQALSTYYDTRKHRLRKAGVSLRVRNNGDGFIQTVKSDGRPFPGLYDRSEWEEAIAGPEPELDRVADVAPPLHRRTVRDHLRPVFTTEIDRRACIVDRHDAKIEVVLDRGEVVVGKRRQPLLELELELIDGSPAALFEVARELRTSVPLRLGVLTKSERGERLATGKGSKAMKAEPIRLDAGMTSAQAFQTIAFACVRHFRVNEPLIIAAHDVDALHQGRVALRRLRSSFSLFRPLLHDSGLNRFKDEIRTLAGTLGEARNLDVLLRRRSEDLSRKNRKALVEERSLAYAKVIDALRSPGVQSMMIDFAEWIALCSFAGTSRWGEHPIGPFSAEILNRFWKKAKRDGRHMRKLDDEERHELRIVGKKLRYAIEFFSALYAREPVAPARDAFLDEMTLVQEHLGALNDLRTERALERALMERNILLPPRMKPEAIDAEADKQLAAADACFERLIEIGPYWR